VGNTATLSDVVTGGSWVSGNTTNVSIGASTGVISALNAGTSVVTYTGTNGCYKTATVTVHNPPGAISGSASICTGHHDTLSNSVSGGSWTSSASSKASVASGTGIVTGVAAGTAVISYTISGCPATTFPVTVSACRDGEISGQVAPELGSDLLQMALFPNPSNGTFTIAQNITVLKQANVIITNTLGQKMFESDLNFDNGTAIFNWPGSVSGVYMVQIMPKSCVDGVTMPAAVTYRIVVEK
jgi:uncharacterized protein YjdB